MSDAIECIHKNNNDHYRWLLAHKALSAGTRDFLRNTACSNPLPHIIAVTPGGDHIQ